MHPPAFAVELFVMVFPFFCWIVTQPKPKVTTVVSNVSAKEMKDMLETDTRLGFESLSGYNESVEEALKLPLTKKMVDQFYSSLEPTKVKNWAIQMKEGEVVSVDANFCPLVQYMLSTGLYESVDINCNDHASFWTNEEIDSLSGSQLEKLDDEAEKHCLDLPSWASQAIDLFDEILKHRNVIALDVVEIVDQVTGSPDSGPISDRLSTNGEAIANVAAQVLGEA